MSAAFGQRRWVNEHQVLAELERLSDKAMDDVAAYADAAQAAAVAEADHKRLRARAVLLAQALPSPTGGKMSVAGAEYTADADDEVATAYLLRLTTAAQQDSIRESLRTIRENQNALRTAAASAREGVAGPGYGGMR